jgi:hypothetical protein
VIRASCLPIAGAAKNLSPVCRCAANSYWIPLQLSSGVRRLRSRETQFCLMPFIAPLQVLATIARTVASRAWGASRGRLRKAFSVGSALGGIRDVEDETAPIVIVIGNDKPLARRRKDHRRREPERIGMSHLPCWALFRRVRLA